MSKLHRNDSYEGTILTIIKEKCEDIVNRLREYCSKYEIQFDSDIKKIQSAVMQVLHTDPFLDYKVRVTDNDNVFGNVIYTFVDITRPKEYYCTVTKNNGIFFLYLHVPVKIHRKISLVCEKIYQCLCAHDSDYYAKCFSELEEIVSWAASWTVGAKLHYEVVFSREEFFKRPFGNLIYDFYTGDKVYSLLYQVAGGNPTLRVYIPVNENLCMFLRMCEENPEYSETSELKRIIG